MSDFTSLPLQPVEAAPSTSVPDDKKFVVVGGDGMLRLLPWSDLSRRVQIYEGQNPPGPYQYGTANMIKSSTTDAVALFAHNGAKWKPAAEVGRRGGVLVRGGGKVWEIFVNSNGQLASQLVESSDDWDWNDDGTTTPFRFLRHTDNNYQLEAYMRYLADTSVNGFTVKLPASPSHGEFVEISDSEGTWDEYPLVVINGKVNDDPGGIILDAPATVRFIYNAPTLSWKVLFYSQPSDMKFGPNELRIKSPGGHVWAASITDDGQLIFNKIN